MRISTSEVQQDTPSCHGDSTEPKGLALVELSIKEAKVKGIKIVRGSGAIFRWSADTSLPLECDALGAVLVHIGEAVPGFPEGWLWRLCCALGVDTYWFWRFDQGFSYNHALTIYTKKKGGDEWVKTIDKVSRAGVALGKKYVG
jgi:hypothetical protein